MRYCLLSRFQGNWLGSIIGEALASNREQSEGLKILQYQPPSWLESRNSLIDCLLSDRQYQIPPNLKSDRLAVLLLPLILFNFDRANLLRQTVTQSNSYCAVTPEDIEDVLIWGNTISLAIREKLDVNNLIKQIIKQILSDIEKNTSLMEKLAIVEQALLKGKTLTSVVESLSTLENPHQIAIALALYCFGSSPEDFDLAVCRAASTGYQAITTVALTSALAGAYNGVTGVPIHWRILGNKNPNYQQAMEQATKLFDAWCGTYDLSINNNNNNFNVVAVPKTIQPRSELKIISQAGY